MKKTTTLLLTLFLYIGASAQIFGPKHHIIVYSTHAVDTTVARPHNKAVGLIRSAGDTLIAYINRAKYTLDIAVYDYVEDSTWYEQGYVPPIHTAINNAYARGVKIRWIHNASDSAKGFANAITPNYGLALINKAIPTLPNPSYSGIMHNKFVVVDGRSSNPNDAIVWTGCMNWEPGQICKDINNIIIFQDSALAHTYLTQFNQMWGDTVEGGVPNTAVSLFGPKEKNITLHNFYIDGHYVESYFSPADNTSNHIISTIQTAKSEIDFEMFAFTLVADDAPLVTATKNGINVYGIMDQSSLSYTPYSDLSNAMGSNLLLYSGLPGYDHNSICHSKYVMVDPCDYAWNADPKILTGSHNWSSSANTVNDENTVIVHDSLVTNQYYQAFHADYLALSTAAGNPVNLVQTCIPLGINEVKDIDQVTLFPNPASNNLKVTLNIPGTNELYSVYNATGQLVLSGKLDARYVNTVDISTLATGMYLFRVISNNTKEFTGKFIKQ
ncbi:MAG TPA: phospholipase D-like domain-containing protein [Bacteroidia bacterium]|jgi:phosphatidylserine/phosphatidylglycerophosphate/cardiolipin synthase-like enzyme|nr:phospholipase D-like domain-containing protein [Bacteroidia bacterium]